MVLGHKTADVDNFFKGGHLDKQFRRLCVKIGDRGSLPPLNPAKNAGCDERRVMY